MTSPAEGTASGTAGPDLRLLAAHRAPDRDWSGARSAHGAFHEVLVGETAVLRVPRGRGGADRVRRETATLRTVGELLPRLPLPRVLPLRADADGPAMLTSRLPGSPAEDLREVTTARLDAYADLLGRLRAAPGPALAHRLPVRAWCGGRDWPRLVAEELVPRLPARHRPVAERALRELLAIEVTATPALCHGDFGPHNILWTDGRPTGLIDLDHAAVGDLALDLAPLVGFHGARAVAPLATHEEVERALHHRATLPLQVAAAAHRAGLDALRDHALAHLSRRADAGTLHDPDGRRPA